MLTPSETLNITDEYVEVFIVEGGANVIMFYDIVRILDKVVGLTNEYIKLLLRVSSLISIVYVFY